MKLKVEGTKVIQVIVTNERRGAGVEGDPVRLIAQMFTLDGELICEEEDKYSA